VPIIGADNPPVP